MRLFTGIEIPPEIAERLLRTVEELRRLPALRFLPPEKLHLTTTFIGEWPAGRLDELKRALGTITVPGPIEIRLARVGWLPSPRFPRVLYAGVLPDPALLELAEATTRVVATLGVEPEKRAFHPHVTLARVSGQPKLHPTPAEVGEIGVFKATSFFLYLSADGQYTKLQEFKLPTS